MSARPCCSTGVRFRRTTGEAVAWILPTALLALVPKCPACVVAYVAVATGLGISFSTAVYLRIGMIVVCVACLGWMAARRLRRLSL